MAAQFKSKDEFVLGRRGVLGGVASLLPIGLADAWNKGAQDSSASASEAIAQEQAAAASSGKGVLLVFHASWCAWCRLMDRMLADPVAVRVIGSRYRVVHVRVQERRPEMVAQQWAGAEEVFNRYAPDGAGLPFIVFLDAEGGVRATNVMDDGANMGFPVTAEELRAFDAMMRRAAPDMPPGDRTSLRLLCERIGEGA